MVNHLRALLIKFIGTLALLYIILGLFYGMTFGNVFVISLVLGIAAYIIGDMLILPRTNNMTATFADFGLALIVIWIMSRTLAYGANFFTISLISAIGVALFEYMFHKYVSNNVLNEAETNQNQRRNLQYQTEASEELTPENTEELKNNDEQ